MKRIVPVLVACLWVLLGGVALGEEIHLVIGKTKVIESPPDLRSIDIDDPSVVDVAIDGDQLLLTGKSAGEAEVSLMLADGQRESYRVIVWEQDVHKVARKLKNALKALGLSRDFEVKVDERDGLVYLTGTVYTEEEMALVDQAVSSCPSEVVVNLVRKDYSVDSIRLSLNVMEVGSSLARGLGITWPQEIKFTSHANDEYDESNNGLTFGDTIRFNVWERTDVDLLIKALESESKGKILARPNVLALNGEEAEITIGGEVPIITYNDGNATVSYRSYGVILKMKPTIIRDGIKLEVECEVSDVDPNKTTSVSVANDAGSAIYNVPGFMVRKAKTILSIENGGTLIIGGLIKNKKGTTYTRLPGISKLPIIGEFFKSRDTQNEDMELVITITPEIVPLKGKGKVRSKEVESARSEEEGIVVPEDSPSSIEDYKRYVRDRIARAMQHIDLKGIGQSTGRVLLSLKLDKDGKVVKVSFRRIDGAKPQVLRRMALNLIRDAQPFLPLPEELEALWIDVPIVFKF